MMLEQGIQAPEFSLQGSDGTTYNLESFHGKNLILYFYPKDDTPGCTLEAKDFSFLKDQFFSLNTVIVGVSADNQEKHCSFIDKHDLTILLLSDPQRDCIQAYGAWGTKNNYGKILQGLIRSTVFIGPDGVVKKAYYNVRAKGHAERVLADLQKA